MSEKRKYSVKELAGILGCSLTAVNKKIIPDENNPEIKRYRNRYDVVIDDGKTMILLDDEELEKEKRLSKGFKNVLNNVSEPPENVIDVDYSTETEQAKETSDDKFITFANVFFERYETLQNKYFRDLLETQKEIKLLTNSESETQKNNILLSSHNKELQEQNKNLQRSNKIMKRCLYVAAGVILVFITLLIFQGWLK